MSKQIGFIGTGLMGLPMAQRLLELKFPLEVYNRTQSKLESLKKNGAKVAKNPADLISSSDCIILMLTNATAINQILFSSRINFSKKTIIQMGTIAPTESKQIAKKVTSLKGEYIEAPVLGSIPEAKDGKLIIMVGSTEKQFSEWKNILKSFGPKPVLIGPVGSVAALKLALNQLIGSLTAAFALSLGFVIKSGIKADQFMDILRNSSLYAPTFEKKLKRMLSKDYSNPNFPTKHLLKDMLLFSREAKSLNMNIKSLKGIEQILQESMKKFSENDYSAIFSIIND